MSIEKRFYGTYTDGKQVDIFTLTNSNGVAVEITNLGGIIVSILVPDKNDNFADVVLGYDSIDGYFKNGSYFGAIIGRHANRIENACFDLNGVEYSLHKNDGNNHIHGGAVGFDKAVWNAEIIKHGNGEALELTYLSKDGEENYPGDLNVKVIYTLTEDNELRIDYHAVSNKDTVINLTNHAYFNLSGHDSGDILDHQLMIIADKFTATNNEGLPTGEIRDVKGTPMDFTKLTPIRTGISSDDEQIKFRYGYDHNWVLNIKGKNPEKVAETYDPKSGRVMEVYTNKPGIQLYTSNFLKEIGKGGAAYGKNDALCLETQFYPNSMKHKHFPSPILKAGEEYNYTTSYKFLVR